MARAEKGGERTRTTTEAALVATDAECLRRVLAEGVSSSATRRLMLFDGDYATMPVATGVDHPPNVSRAKLNHLTLTGEPRCTVAPEPRPPLGGLGADFL